MSRYRLSAMAETDLAEIADYTTDVWGAKQAELYLNNLVECFIRIAQMPELGRPCDAVHPGFRRIEQGRHVIFYKPRKTYVFIARILHRNMLPTRHQLMDDGS